MSVHLYSDSLSSPSIFIINPLLVMKLYGAHLGNIFISEASRTVCSFMPSSCICQRLGKMVLQQLQSLCCLGNAHSIVSSQGNNLVDIYKMLIDT